MQNSTHGAILCIGAEIESEIRREMARENELEIARVRAELRAQFESEIERAREQVHQSYAKRAADLESGKKELERKFELEREELLSQINAKIESALQEQNERLETERQFDLDQLRITLEKEHFEKEQKSKDLTKCLIAEQQRKHNQWIEKLKVGTCFVNRKFGFFDPELSRRADLESRKTWESRKNSTSF